MKVPRPRPAEKPFRRGSAPPPAATKLLLASMSAGVILIVVLAIVFIPRALQNEGQPPIPQIRLAVSSVAGTAWANVTQATVAVALADYNATVVRATGSGSTTVGGLEALADGATGGSVTFRDEDGDGGLSAGDTFVIMTEPGSTYSLYIWYKREGKLVGIATWAS